MESYNSRLTACITTFLIALTIASVINYSSILFFPQHPIGDVTLDQVYDFTVHPYLNADQSNIGFHLTADFTSAFQWNTKQLFVYVMVKYETPTHSRNEVVLWDTIIGSKNEAKLNFTRVINEYPLRDRFRNLKNTNLDLILAYRYMPRVGLMKEYTAAKASFQMPSKYFRYSSTQ